MYRLKSIRAGRTCIFAVFYLLFLNQLSFAANDKDGVRLTEDTVSLASKKPSGVSPSSHDSSEIHTFGLMSHGNWFRESVWYLGLGVVRAISNRSMIIPFFTGKQIYRKVPHVRSHGLFGHLHFTTRETEAFTAAAKSTPNGIATYWIGPYPMLYIVNNDTRRAIVQESHMGVVDPFSWEFLRWFSGRNNVMGTFPDFRPIDSNPHDVQRAFLLKHFMSGSKRKLPEIRDTAEAFLKEYSEKQGETSRPLRDLITALVLRISSQLLGLTDFPLDLLYFENEEYHFAIDRVAQYGISQRGDPAFEKLLANIFFEIFKNNFRRISEQTAETNLIRNIFESLKVPFPVYAEDFLLLPEQTKHTIAMNFTAVGLGAMVHSTANTLDWAIARLLDDPAKMDEFVRLMTENKGLDLAHEESFDKSREGDADSGKLFPISEWVLHNVFLNPPFSHEFFFNREPYVVSLPDGTEIKIPGMSFVVVNYVECNRSDAEMTSAATFSSTLSEKSTAEHFMKDSRVASFGGSKICANNGRSRICPGAKVSLYEQMIVIATLLRDYSFELEAPKEFSCEIDPIPHPLRTRKNIGRVRLIPR